LTILSECVRRGNYNVFIVPFCRIFLLNNNFTIHVLYPSLFYSQNIWKKNLRKPYVFNITILFQIAAWKYYKITQQWKEKLGCIWYTSLIACRRSTVICLLLEAAGRWVHRIRTHCRSVWEANCRYGHDIVTTLSKSTLSTPYVYVEVNRKSFVGVDIVDIDNIVKIPCRFRQFNSHKRLHVPTVNVAN
jgi:hypothetical protein